MPYIHIPEIVGGGGRLGRHVNHDPRSRRYAAPTGSIPSLTSVRHKRHVPVFHQGNLGSCTGNAALGAIATSPFYETLTKDMQSSIGQETAIKLYSVATEIDPFEGTYPPEDTGSDGLSVAKAAKNFGYISGYRHAFGLASALTALNSTPVISGVRWYSSFDLPDPSGNVSIHGDAFVRGGHEIVLDELDVTNKRVGFTNSWGSIWGKDGRAYFSWDTFERLLNENGDVTVFVPLTKPTPRPAPPTIWDIWRFILEIFKRLS